MSRVNGSRMPELLIPEETASQPSISEQSVSLDLTVQNVLTEASQASQEMLREVKELIGTGAGEGSFKETATFIVDDESQKLIIQREIQFSRD